MDVSRMTFEQMQTTYRLIKHTWTDQGDATKRVMAEQIRAIYHSLAPGERGFMTDIHHLELEINRDLGRRSSNA